MCYNIASGVVNNLKGSFFLIGILTLLLNNRGYAQALGDPIVNIDFGAGTDEKAGALPADLGYTNYIYTTNRPDDGYYTITNTTNGLNPSWWWTTSDHTGNPGGYMMVVNGSFDPGIFYERTVTGLCGNTKYQFAVWIKSLLNYDDILPNVAFSIETSTGTVLSSGTTGDIPTGNTWIQYPVTFTLPDNTETIVIRMTNNAPGGSGNDIAIDDITIKPYVVPVTAVLTPESTTQTLCAGISQKITISTTTPMITGYLQKLQQLIDGIWIDQSLAGTASSYTISSPIDAGIYSYRIIPVTANNVNLSTCAVSSKLLTLTVVASPKAAFFVPDITNCLGDPTYFKDQSESTMSALTKWFWNFGDGATSDLQNPLHQFVRSGVYPVSLTVTSALGCSNEITKDINIIYGTPLADFTSVADTTCVDNSTYFKDRSESPMSAITKWFWNFGDGRTSDLQNPSHQFAHSGAYPVSLTITSALGCSTTATKNINIIYATPLANFTSVADTTCVGNSTYFKDQSESSISALTKWSWNFGDGGTSDLQNPSHQFVRSGAYPVSLTVTSALGCSNEITKNVNIVYATSAANFTSVANTTCVGNPNYFKDQSVLSTSYLTKWFWNFGDGATSDLQNPSHQFARSGAYPVSLTVTSALGCSTTATKIIKINYATPVANFMVKANNICSADSTYFKDQSESSISAITKWFWNFGDGATSDLQNTSHKFARSGVYPVSLTITSALGCSATLTKNINLVYATPIANFTATADTTCSGDLTYFKDQSESSISAITKWVWNFGDGTTSDLQNPSHQFTRSGVYPVSLTITSALGCSSTVTKNINVNHYTPVANFSVINAAGLCSSQEVIFTNQSTIDFGLITKIEWYFDYGNHQTVTETDTNPYYGKLYYHTYTKFYSPATINYQVRMRAYTNSSCVSEINKTVTLLATPKLTFAAPKQICQNAGSIQLAAGEVNGISGSGRYSGTGVTTSGSFNPSITGIGTFGIKYIFTSINGCTDTISQDITVNAPPTVNAGSDMVVLEGGSANMTATANGNNLSYKWYPSTGLSSSDVLNPVVTPTTDLNYTLTVTNAEGCAASSQVLVSVTKKLVIPNTFTPNGDGINDTWNINLLASNPDVKIEVFNRYGAKVFYSTGYSVPWDGRYNGVILPTGTYYYIINQKQGKKISSGSVTIIK